MTTSAQQPHSCAATQTSAGEGATVAAAPSSAAISLESEPQPLAPKRPPARYLWAALIARIYQVFPWLCPICGGQMRIIAFITDSDDTRHILAHIGVDTEPHHITPSLAKAPKKHLKRPKCADLGRSKSVLYLGFMWLDFLSVDSFCPICITDHSAIRILSSCIYMSIFRFAAIRRNSDRDLLLQKKNFFPL